MSVSKLKTDIIKPSREEAEAAVRTLLLWAGDNPDRDGLKEYCRYIFKTINLTRKYDARHRTNH